MTTLTYRRAEATRLHVEVEIWDYADHPGDCCPRIVDGVWVVCCRECAGTGVFPVPWIRNVTEGRARDDASCVTCKGTGRAQVVVAS